MKPLKELLVSLGIHATYKGYRYLIASMEIALEDENNLLFHTRSIFPKVALRYHTNARCVERDIRTVIHVCWDSSYRQALAAITPYTLVKPPTVGEFLDLLYWNLKTYPCLVLQER